MTPEAASEFLIMVQKETEACGDNPDLRCVGLFIQAEAIRQNECWVEALRLAKEGIELGPQLSPKGRKTGAKQFCQLISAYGYHAIGNPSAAREALAKLDTMGNDYFFHKQVEFKATHLKRLVGAEFKDSYTTITVANRSKVRMVLDVPAGIEVVEWDWVLAEFTISFTATFYEEGKSNGNEIQKVAQHSSDNGPIVGNLEVKGPGSLELIFDNTFSILRSKTVECRLQPTGLVVKQEVTK